MFYFDTTATAEFLTTAAENQARSNTGFSAKYTSR
jgi:hypothetical protein